MTSKTIEKLIKHIRILYPAADLRPSHIADSVSRLSEDFVNSKQTSGYLDDIDAYIAYLLYFMPVNMLKLPYMLDKIDLSQYTTLRILDCGTGTGTFTLAAIDYFSKKYPDIKLHITMTDTSPSHIESTRRLFTSMYDSGDIPAHQMNYLVLDLQNINSLNKPYDLIILGNVINEVNKTNYKQISTNLHDRLENNGHIVMIEPALKELSQRALDFRDEAIKHRLFPIFPCVQTKQKASSCPALRDNDWCHQTHSIDKDKWISGIDKHTGFIKDDIRYTGIIFSKHHNVSDKDIWRIVSDIIGEKGLSKAYLCHDNIRILARRLDRNRSEHNIKWNKLKKGDMIELQNESMKADLIDISAQTTIN